MRYHRFTSTRVIPAKAGTHERRGRRTFAGFSSWIPASAGMTLLLALSACGRDGEGANNQAAAAPAKASQTEGDVGTAERLVRAQLGNPEGVTFSNPRRSISEGVTIICGDYEQSGSRQRYIVVGGEEVFVESGMEAGEMDRAFTEFCGDGERA